MKYTKLCVLLVLGLAFLVDASTKLKANHQAKTRLNALKTCEVALYGSVLQGDCQTADGDWQFASLDLNTCLGNNNGKVVCDKNLFNSAANATLSGSTLKLSLRKRDQSWAKGQSVDLNNYLDNKNGLLLCDCRK